MSRQSPQKEIRCVRCGRVIENCACCGEPDCPPPLCGPCLRDLMATELGRLDYMHGGASFASEVEESLKPA